TLLRRATIRAASLLPFFFFVPPICPPPTFTLFPYTTLFRSQPVLVETARTGTVPASSFTRPSRPAPAGSPRHRPTGGPRAGGRRGPPRARRWPRGRQPSSRPLWAGPGAPWVRPGGRRPRSEEHTSELQSRFDLVCRLLLV